MGTLRYLSALLGTIESNANSRRSVFFLFSKKSKNYHVNQLIKWSNGFIFITKHQKKRVFQRYVISFELICIQFWQREALISTNINGWHVCVCVFRWNRNVCEWDTRWSHHAIQLISRLYNQGRQQQRIPTIRKTYRLHLLSCRIVSNTVTIYVY